MRARTSLRIGMLPLALAAAAAAEPLDVNDPMPRDVLVQLESSSDPAAVGQSFGPALPATYSASGGVGAFVIPVETHEAMRAFLPPVPGSFTPITIQIDLATHAASSQPAGGAMADGPITFSFSLSALSTAATAGFVGPNFSPPLLCTSQQQIDDLCPVFPPICGKTCIFVSGSAYDPGTGKVNLVGGESQSGCDGAVCQGPFTLFSTAGDLRLLEANEVPALPWPAPALVALAMAAFAACALRMRPADALRHQRPRL